MDADPHFMYDQASLELLMNVYEPLIFWNFVSTGNFIGIVADTWSGELCDVTDPITGQHYGQKWTFHIRTGAGAPKFHSSAAVTVPGEGDTVTIYDVEYSFERGMVVDAVTGGEILLWEAFLPGIGGAADLEDPLFGEKIKFAVQTDAVGNNVIFYLVGPFEPFLQIVSQMFAPIMSKAWCIDATLHPDNWDGVWPDYSLPSGDGEDNPQNYTRWHKYHDPETSPLYTVDCSSSTPHPHLDYMIGTGPYMFDYWNKGAGGHYRLTKNAAYWRGWSSPAHVDNFISKYISTWETRRDHFKAGDADVVTVPRMYMEQVEGEPGIRGMYGLESLYCLGMFFNQAISAASTYIGDPIPANGTFNGFGFPRNGFTDIKLRKAFRALFPYDPWLSAAYEGEAVQPASCVVKGLAYYDPSIQKPVYDRNLAIKLLK